MATSKDSEQWDLIVKSKYSLFDIDLQSLWKYRDLIMLFVKRDFVAIYKQTILGPLWYVIQPVLTTVVFTFVFGSIAKIPTGNIPAPLFYMAALVCWNFFSSCLVKTSATFITNSGIFGKVYFPRLAVPVSVVISNLIAFVIQLFIFLVFWLYYYSHGANIHFEISYLLMFPVILLIMALMGLGCGIIISSITTKYRDLAFLVGFGVQLLMYCSSVIFPLDHVSGKLKVVIMANPMTSMIEAFRYIFTGSGTFEWMYICYSAIFTFVVLFAGILIFNKVEKTFMDTV
jgi:lipopolysaccharide transport system permease protein